jgi:hypothetical protein
MAFTLSQISAAAAAIFRHRRKQGHHIPRLDRLRLTSRELADLNLPPELRATMAAERSREWQRLL